jgi:hypothetical protein
MIELMGRGFAPFAAVLSFVAVGMQSERSALKVMHTSRN